MLVISGMYVSTSGACRSAFKTLQFALKLASRSPSYVQKWLFAELKYPLLGFGQVAFFIMLSVRTAFVVSSASVSTEGAALDTSVHSAGMKGNKP